MPREKWQKGLSEIVKIAGDFKITGKEEWLNDIRVIEQDVAHKTEASEDNSGDEEKRQPWELFDSEAKVWMPDGVDQDKNDEIEHIGSEAGEEEGDGKNKTPNWGGAFDSLDLGTDPK